MTFVLVALLSILTACSGSNNSLVPTGPSPGDRPHKGNLVDITVYDDLTSVQYFATPFEGCIPGVAFFVPSGHITSTKTEVGGFLPHCIGSKNLPAVFITHHKKPVGEDYAVLQVGGMVLQRDTCQLDMFYVNPGKAEFVNDPAWGQGISCYVVQTGDLKAEFVIEPPNAPPPKPGHPFQ